MRFNKSQKTAGFTMVEIMIAVVVIGILAGLYSVYAPGVFSYLRVKSTLSDIQAYRAAVVDANTRLGGNLPITEYNTTLPAVSGTNLAQSNNVSFYFNARLEQVLMALPNPLLTKYITPAIGSQVFQRADGGTANDLTYNPTTGLWNTLGSDVTLNYNMSYEGVSRLEACICNTGTIPGNGSANNFDLTGINGNTSLQNGCTIAFVEFVNVAGIDAYNLATALNPAGLMQDTSGNASMAQWYGPVVYRQTSNGVTNVYVYLASF